MRGLVLQGLGEFRLC